MNPTFLVIMSLFVGTAVGWGTAVLMMGTKISEANDIIFQKEVARRMALAKLVEDASKTLPPHTTEKKQKNNNPSRRK